MIGDRLRHLRMQRGLYQTDVATRADISTSYLSRLEKGERRLTERSLIVRLAEALGVSPSELMGHPIDWSDPQMADAQASIAALRLTLATTQLGSRSTETVRPMPALHKETVQVVRARTDCDFVRLGAILPGLISELHTAVVDSIGEERETALHSLFVACNSAMTLAHAQGYQMEAWIAAQRVQQIADEIGHSAWHAMAAFTAVHALLPMGGHAAAYEVASRAADRARGLDGPLGVTDSAAAAYGSLLLASALTASITGRSEESADRLVEASEVAERTGEGSPLVATFGPTNVAIYSMTSAWSVGTILRLSH
ncbi:MAG: helix-turn-helix domain-containing protein [Sciscionella sp.]